ncbi:LOW QUALITY PROTEIN: hypothetical protein BU14_0023s0073 [Porphyra umbilicalis]|uniref:Uncharacterized protein n=1 Tax=Porphyra umbilicalis TaxID=2786 RepID=A0A1X6PKB5_PORUM|nr:LOW QUALITY PROTEIN: hypothetical protein BU14_0023s0073 [Porphyra umbilicalis]|eukprot:OSX81270.1 LOW QUALITY PROTEIN: hypothetical protein BU14_0023s0073 [Porphyra umbilicalis]
MPASCHQAPVERLGASALMGRPARASKSAASTTLGPSGRVPASAAHPNAAKCPRFCSSAYRSVTSALSDMAATSAVDAPGTPGGSDTAVDARSSAPAAATDAALVDEEVPCGGPAVGVPVVAAAASAALADDGSTTAAALSSAVAADCGSERVVGDAARAVTASWKRPASAAAVMAATAAASSSVAASADASDMAGGGGEGGGPPAAHRRRRHPGLPRRPWGGAPAAGGQPPPTGGVHPKRAAVPQMERVVCTPPSAIVRIRESSTRPTPTHAASGQCARHAVVQEAAERLGRQPRPVRRPRRRQQCVRHRRVQRVRVGADAHPVNDHVPVQRVRIDLTDRHRRADGHHNRHTRARARRGQRVANDHVPRPHQHAIGVDEVPRRQQQVSRCRRCRRRPVAVRQPHVRVAAASLPVGPPKDVAVGARADAHGRASGEGAERRRRPVGELDRCRRGEAGGGLFEYRRGALFRPVLRVEDHDTAPSGGVWRRDGALRGLLPIRPGHVQGAVSFARDAIKGEDTRFDGRRGNVEGRGDFHNKRAHAGGALLQLVPADEGGFVVGHGQRGAKNVIIGGHSGRRDHNGRCRQGGERRHPRECRLDGGRGCLSRGEKYKVGRSTHHADNGPCGGGLPDDNADVKGDVAAVPVSVLRASAGTFGLPFSTSETFVGPSTGCERHWCRTAWNAGPGSRRYLGEEAMRGGPTANHRRLFAIVPRQERRLARRADLKPPQPVSLGALALARGAHPAAVDAAPEPLWDPDVHPSWILNSHLWAPRRILTEGSLDGRHSSMACPSAAWYVEDDERRQQDSGYVEPCRGLAHVALRYRQLSAHFPIGSAFRWGQMGPDEAHRAPTGRPPNRGSDGRSHEPRAEFRAEQPTAEARHARTTDASGSLLTTVSTAATGTTVINLSTFITPSNSRQRRRPRGAERHRHCVHGAPGGLRIVYGDDGVTPLQPSHRPLRGRRGRRFEWIPLLPPPPSSSPRGNGASSMLGVGLGAGGWRPPPHATHALVFTVARAIAVSTFWSGWQCREGSWDGESRRAGKEQRHGDAGGVRQRPRGCLIGEDDASRHQFCRMATRREGRGGATRAWGRRGELLVTVAVAAG